jgi:PAS domain S-box-containing protein
MKPKILIVEDEMLVAHSIRLTLERLGYTVAGLAATGEKAVQMALQSPPDLILMDIRLQGPMDGIEAAEQIRARLDVPVVYATANTDDTTLKRAKLEGPLSYICKPFEERDLRVAVEVALHNHRMERSLRLRNAILEAASFAAHKFLSSGDWRETTREMVACLGKACEVTRVFVLQNRLAEDGAPAPRRLYEWLAPGTETFPHAQPGRLQSYRAAGFARWEAVLSADQIVHGHVKDFPESEQGVLTRAGICSSLAVPVFAGREWWGAIGLDQCQTEREWSPAEIDGLKMLAHVLGAAIQRERSLEKIHEQAALLQVTQDAIFVRDPAGQVLFWNRAAERLYGWKAEEVVGRANTNFLYEPGFLAEANLALKLAGIRGEWRGELHQLTRDQRAITVEARLALIRDAQQQPKAILFVNTDITEKKLMERAFLRSQRLESIGTLAAGIAHDLNNILAPIMMASQILELQSGDEEARQLLATIRGGAKRGADVVRQVLTFGRGIEGERVPIQSRHLLKEMTRIIKETFPRNITAHCDVPNDLWTVIGDATQLHQVLMNLCVNARDAMPQGGQLTLSAQNLPSLQPPPNSFGQPGAGPQVLIQVSDTGQGIAREILDKIFDPFFTTKAQAQGTGLGLSTVLGIVKSHGGFLSVESEPGRGATFRVYLPANPERVTPEPGPETRVVAAGKGEMVLVVDDEESIREITRNTLLKRGYQVLLAADGREALALLAERDGQVKVVLTDIMMPVMDGPALVRALRQTKPQIKIIACTGLGPEDHEPELRALGVESFLTKPYAPDKLFEALHRELTPAAPQPGEPAAAG